MEKHEIDELCRRLTDQGRLVEAGFLSLRFMAIAPDAPKVQVDEMRKAFFCGAQHLFASIMGMLEPGAEPTDTDLSRMDSISKELTQFEKQLWREHGNNGAKAEV